MSMILKGIDIPKHGETKRIVLYDNGDIVVDEDGWDEDGNRYYRTTYDTQAIQIPRGHGRLIDESDLTDELTELNDLNLENIAPTILEAED